MMKKIWVGILLTVVVSGGIWLILNRQQEGQSRKKSDLRTTEAKKQDVADVLKLRGVIVAAKKVSISSEATGQVIKIHARQGEKVEKGQVLLEIDPSQIQNRIEKQKINLEKADITLKNTQAEYERAQALFKEQLIAESKMEEFKKALDLAKLDHQFAKKEMDSLELQLQKVTLVAPISGIITSASVEEGAVVGSVTEGAASQALMVITDVSSKTIELMVGDADRFSLEPGREIEFWADTAPQERSRGKVTAMDAAATSQGGGGPGYFRVEIEIQGDQEKFPLGSNVTVQVTLQEARGVVAVPLEAVFKEGEEKFVYLVSKKSGFEKRNVVTGTSNVNAVEIKQGLNEGETVYLDEPEAEEA